MDVTVKKLKLSRDIVYQGRLSREKARSMKYWYYFGWWTQEFKADHITEDSIKNYYYAGKAIYQIAPHMTLQELKQDREQLQWLLDEYGRTREYPTCMRFKNYVLATLRTAVEDRYIDGISSSQLKINSVESTWTGTQIYQRQHRPKALNEKEFIRFKEFVDCKLAGLLNEAPITSHAGRVGQNGKQSHFSEQAKLMTLSILAHTGCRYAESLGIQLCDVKDDYLIIDKSWDYKRDTGFKMTKNVASIRNVYVDDTLIDLMRKFGAWKAEHYGVIEGLPLAIEPSSTTTSGAINVYFRKIQKELGFKTSLSTHKLRHTYISYLLARGVDMKLIADQVGHRDTLMIQKVYGHLLDERRTKERAKIANLLK